MTEVFHKTGFFFPLGALLAIGVSGVERRLPGLPNWLYAGCGLIVANVAAGVEAGQLLLPGKNADLTDFLLEVLGAVIGFVAMRLLLKPLCTSIDAQRAPSRVDINGRQGRTSARRFPATAREESCDSQSGWRDRKWSRYVWLWGSIAMVGIVWAATHSALAPYNLRKLVQTPVPLFEALSVWSQPSTGRSAFQSGLLEGGLQTIDARWCRPLSPYWGTGSARGYYFA